MKIFKLRYFLIIILIVIILKIFYWGYINNSYYMYINWGYINICNSDYMYNYYFYNF